MGNICIMIPRPNCDKFSKNYDEMRFAETTGRNNEGMYCYQSLVIERRERLERKKKLMLKPLRPNGQTGKRSPMLFDVRGVRAPGFRLVNTGTLGEHITPHERIRLMQSLL